MIYINIRWRHFKDYNAQGKDLYKIIGLPGRCSDIWRKAIRFPAAMETQQFDLKLYRDALDLLVYCAMYCIVWKDSKIEFKQTWLIMVCCICHKIMGYKDGKGTSGISHGYCDKCRDKELIKIKEYADEKDDE